MSGEPNGARYSLTGDAYPDENEFWGHAQDAIGLFTPLAEGLRRVTLLGCAPQGRLRRSLEHLGGKRANAGNGCLHLLDSSGTPIGDYVINHVTAEAVKPSATGTGLVDLTVHLSCDNLLPESDRPWELIRTKQLNRPGMWHSLNPTGRRAWLSVALNHHHYRALPDDPPGTRYELDGRHIVDADSFYCALGEAINGPGGYFGCNLDALVDCLRGRWGATSPFTLTWSHSNFARSRLTTQIETTSGTVPLLDLIMQILQDGRVDITTC